MDISNLRDIWKGMISSSHSTEIQIRNTGVSGLYIAFDSNIKACIVIIRIQEAWDEKILPEWAGLEINVQTLKLPVSLPHLVLKLLKDELDEIFLLFCCDLIKRLDKSVGDERDGRIQETLNLWAQFFKSASPRLMSREKQQGLFTELLFLFKLLKESDLSKGQIVWAWKGAERAYHDFQYMNRVVEIKSTTSKQPRKIKVSNEKQLNSDGLDALFLLAVSLTTVSGGDTLGDIAEQILEILSLAPLTRDQFVIKLAKAGFLLDYSSSYPTGYAVEKLQYFLVQDGFPRLVDLTEGVGDIKYSVTLSACKNFIIDENVFMKRFING